MILLNAFKDTQLYRSLTEGLGKWYRDADSEAARCFHDLKAPSYVKQILNIGCGAGKNFRPYNFLYRLWGIDVVPYHRIKWIAPFSNLRYEQLSVEQLTKILNKDDVDLSETLIISDCVLMHVSEADQYVSILRPKSLVVEILSSASRHLMILSTPIDTSNCLSTNLNSTATRTTSRPYMHI